MSFPPALRITNSKLNKIGDVLVLKSADSSELISSRELLSRWRAGHAYPINTFQATLRNRLKQIDPEGIAAQRLKRLPTIIDKLQRFPEMKLSRMQDIGGVRAIVGTIKKVRELEAQYREKKRFEHELVGSKDYITSPAPSGYRSVHLIYKYKNKKARSYNGLALELQIRTKLQHAWATAVETMGTFLGQALKSSQGDKDWRDFFAATSSAFAYMESTPRVPGYESLSKAKTFLAVAEKASALRVVEKLKNFTLAAKYINENKTWYYHLIVLDSSSNRPEVRVTSYSRDSLSEATAEYAKEEVRAANGEKIEPVLVAAGPLNQLRRAYPNFFLDTKVFVSKVERIIEESSSKVS